MNRIEMLQKAAAQGDIPRALESTVNATNLGIERLLANRAWQGKANAGVQGTTAHEKELLSKLRKDDSGKHRAARFLMHGLTGAPNLVYRDIAARAMLARAKDPNVRVHGKKTNQILAQLREDAEQKTAAQGDIPRALESTVNAANFGIDRFLANRAWQGKANAGVQGTTAHEKELLSKLRKDDSGKHRAARFLMHGLTGAPNLVYRDIAARAMLARAKDPNVRVHGKKTNQILAQLREDAEQKIATNFQSSESIGNAASLGVNRLLTNKAWQGKVNAGIPGTTIAENELLKRLRPDDSGNHKFNRKVMSADLNLRDVAARAMLSRALNPNARVHGRKTNQILAQLRESAIQNPINPDIINGEF